MKKLLYSVQLLLILPVTALAAFGPGTGGSGGSGDGDPFVGQGLSTWITSLISFINGILVPLVFALAFIVFLWGVFKTFILGGGDEEKQKEGKQLMLYAIIGFVLMLAIWGIVNLLVGATGLEGDSIQLPNPSPIPVERQ